MSILAIYDRDDFLKTDFSQFDEIIITESVEIPVREGIISDPGFEIRTTFPHKVREKFLHPSLYYSNSFSDEYKGQVEDLAKRVKRGQKIRFLYSDNNLLLLCCIMSEIFQDCQGHHRDYLENTNIPFPYKRSETANSWVWACNWGREFPQRIESEGDIENFRNYVRFDFPQFHSEHFPVNALKKAKEGVTSFSVHLDVGVLEVIPGRPVDEIKVTINDFPSGKLDQTRLNSRNEMRISLSIERGQTRWSGHLTFTQILRFLLIHHASKRYLGLAYAINDDAVMGIFYHTNSRLEMMPYKELFLAKTGKYDPNFSATLAKLLTPVTDNNVAKKDILKLSDKGHRLPCPHNRSLQVECYHNIRVVFSPNALVKFMHLELDENIEDIRYEGINFADLKKEILSELGT